MCRVTSHFVLRERLVMVETGCWRLRDGQRFGTGPMVVVSSATFDAQNEPKIFRVTLGCIPRSETL